MSKEKNAGAVAPRSVASLSAATKLLEVFCLTPVKARTVAGAVKAVLAWYLERGEPSPVTERTLRYWAEHGVVVAGHPELAQPFLAVAKLHDQGRNILIELGRGDAAGLMLTEQTLDKAVALMGSILDSTDGKKDLEGDPKLLNEMAARLTAVLQLRQKAGTPDIWTALDRFSREDAERAIEKLLDKYPAIEGDIRQALLAENGAN